MVKNTIKQFYGLVDASNEAELNAALESLKAGSVEAAPESAEEKEEFGEITDAGGTTYYFEGPDDAFGLGTKLYADEELTEEIGSIEFTLENGDLIITDEFGNVAEILGEGEEEEEEASATPSSVKETTTTETVFQEEAVEEEMQEENQAVEQILEALAPVFSAIEERLMALEGNNEALSKENDELKEELSKEKAEKEKLAAVPAAKPFTASSKTKTEFNRKKSIFDRAVESGKFKKHTKR